MKLMNLKLLEKIGLQTGSLILIILIGQKYFAAVDRQMEEFSQQLEYVKSELGDCQTRYMGEMLKNQAVIIELIKNPKL